MVRICKRRKEANKLVEESKAYDLKEAISILKKMPKGKFDETVELAVKINVDSKASNMVIRGTVSLPHGTGKKVRIAVFCDGEDIKKATEAGANFSGSKELIDKVAGGWCDFDVAISTPSMMRELGKLGKVLGPRGLMPNPKAGTVTQDITKAINELKKGKIEFKMDKQTNINCAVAKISFAEEAICENINSLVKAVQSAGAGFSAIKGGLIRSINISTTMSPGIKLNLSAWR